MLANVLYFALMMASFVLGITLGFNLMEETGYLARISFLFDHTMSKVGLQGKTIIPFFMGLAAQLPVQPAHVSLITGDNVYLPLRCHGLFRVRQLYQLFRQLPSHSLAVPEDFWSSYPSFCLCF
ncbi:hypothetical protein DWX98_04260 [Blautia sp. AF22-5LB]|nr:hypothetical protein DWX98_04260 [Blautia sp. AF22-5LB]